MEESQKMAYTFGIVHTKGIRHLLVYKIWNW